MEMTMAVAQAERQWVGRWCRQVLSVLLHFAQQIFLFRHLVFAQDHQYLKDSSREELRVFTKKKYNIYSFVKGFGGNWQQLFLKDLEKNNCYIAKWAQKFEYHLCAPNTQQDEQVLSKLLWINNDWVGGWMKRTGYWGMEILSVCSLICCWHISHRPLFCLAPPFFF